MAQQTKPTGETGGFTLVEMLVALAILAVITAIAVPVYTQYVTRSNRAEAMVALEQSAQSLEQCFTLLSDFDHDDCNVEFPIDSENGWYQITAVRNQASFVLTATPQGSQATRDTNCGSLTLTSAGVRNATGPGGAAACW